MKFKIQFTLNAEKDINEIYQYVSFYDSKSNAEKLVNNLIHKCEDLSLFPNRGHKFPELKYFEEKDYIEIHYKPYRIIYRIIERIVFVHCVLDGRRNINDILHKRLTR